MRSAQLGDTLQFHKLPEQFPCSLPLTVEIRREPDSCTSVFSVLTSVSDSENTLQCVFLFCFIVLFTFFGRLEGVIKMTDVFT